MGRIHHLELRGPIIDSLVVDMHQRTDLALLAKARAAAAQLGRPVPTAV